MSALEITGIVVMLIIFGAVGIANIFLGPRVYQKRVDSGKDPLTNFANKHPRWAPYIYALYALITIILFVVVMNQIKHP